VSLPPFPFRALGAGLALALLGALPAAANGVPPLDQCVAAKLAAAATQCQDSLHAWAKWERRKVGDKLGREERLGAAGDALASAWADADAAAEMAGADCATATGDASRMDDLIRDRAKNLAKRINRQIDPNDKTDRVCAARTLLAASQLCDGLVGAESTHLATRFSDRLREGLATDRDAALSSFDADWDALAADCDPPLARLKVEAMVDRTTSDAVEVATVSPSVTQDWEMIEPPANVDYEGKTLDPSCWDGAPWVFFVHRGTVNKLVMYYQGGGACWSGATCGGIPGITGPTFKTSTGPDDNPANYHSGFADLSNPKNPFKDWNIVFVPYCTGDIHWGDSEVDYELELSDLSIRVTHVRHKGFVNAQVAEKWAREHFVHPEQVFVTGSSAGAYGAIVNSLYLQERAYPSADFSVVGDAGNGVVTSDFLVNDLSNWGIQNNLPAWMPGLNVPLTDLAASDLYIEAAKTYPQNRFATYTTAYDGGNGGQTGFFQVMRNPDNALFWLRWWESSCLWNQEMTALNAAIQAEVPDNFRSYVGTGSAHTMWGRDKVYDDTTGNVPTVKSWLKAMLNDSPDWVNVQCEDCGLLLDGDPRPVPSNIITPPFDPFDLDAGRILCEAP